MNDSPNVVDKLNELIRLDYDAIEAYQAAAAKLEDPELRERIAKFGEDHVGHVELLSALVDGYGGVAATGPDLKQVLTKGKVVIADIVGGDHLILMAMKANEDVTNETYETVLKQLGPAKQETRSIVEKNLGDERRHRAWIEQQLEKMRSSA